MNGFLDDKPIMAKVSWVADEVPLLNSQPEQYGLRAEVPSGDGVTQYFVPWGQVTYLKQEQSAAETGGAGAPPVSIPITPAPPVTDLPPG
jgi:hypothetical protein